MLRLPIRQLVPCGTPCSAAYSTWWGAIERKRRRPTSTAPQRWAAAQHIHTLDAQPGDSTRLALVRSPAHPLRHAMQRRMQHAKRAIERSCRRPTSTTGWGWGTAPSVDRPSPPAGQRVVAHTCCTRLFDRCVSDMVDTVSNALDTQLHLWRWEHFSVHHNVAGRVGIQV